MYGCGIDSSATIMFDAHSRSGPTWIGWTIFDWTWRWFTIRKTGKGQSLQCLRKKNTNGRHASKKASQLETTTATELANAFSSRIRHSCGSRIGSARDFFARRAAGATCDADPFWVCLRPPKEGAHWFRLVV